MEKYDYFKYHALGNDYIVIDPQMNSIELSEEKIRLLCDRNFGIGSDGILYGPIFDSNNEINLRIFNPDGGEAEKSGNGIREFAKYLHDVGYVDKKSFELKTIGGKAKVTFLDESAKFIKVDMGIPVFTSKDIPTNFKESEAINQTIVVDGNSYMVSCVSVGNPHCVILSDAVSKTIANSVGPKIEHHNMFPNKINVQFLKVIDRSNIQIEIWERGAGYTLASGTSSCAAASVAHKLDLVDDTVSVHMPGGIITISFAPNGHIFMTGEVTAVSYGYFSNELLNQKI